jgi:hypothetical protein
MTIVRRRSGDGASASRGSRRCSPRDRLAALLGDAIAKAHRVGELAREPNGRSRHRMQPDQLEPQHLELDHRRALFMPAEAMSRSLASVVSRANRLTSAGSWGKAARCSAPSAS